MIISCPSCAAEYQVPDSASARRVRCARCTTEWIPSTGAVVTTAVPAKVEPAPPRPAMKSVLAPEPVLEDDAPDGSAVDRIIIAGDTTPERISRFPLVAALWALSAVVIGGGGTAAYLERHSIMQAWPPSIRVYASLGL